MTTKETMPPLPPADLASILEEAASNPHYQRADYVRWMKQASDALHAINKWAGAPAANPTEQAAPVQEAQEPKPADCSGDPKCCPQNEGYGCACWTVEDPYATSETIAFEKQAKFQGLQDFTKAEAKARAGEIPATHGGKFVPATYYNFITELAYRTWANKPAALASRQPVQPRVAPSDTVDGHEFRELVIAWANIAHSEDLHGESDAWAAMIARIDAWRATGIAAEREECAALADQWGNARQDESGGNALRNYAIALRQGVKVGNPRGAYDAAARQAQLVREALTYQQVHDIWHATVNGLALRQIEPQHVCEYARAIERAHGIAAAKDATC